MHPRQRTPWEPPASCKQYSRPGDLQFQRDMQLDLHMYSPVGRETKSSLIGLPGGTRETNNPINVIGLSN